MKKKQCNFSILCVLVLCTGNVTAQYDFLPMPSETNRIDGQVTFPAEWSSASSIVNQQGTGTYHAENQQNWLAFSSSGNSNTYLGTTAFILHDIWGATTSELADYNTFEFTLNSQTVKLWIFANDDEANDFSWIGNSGLGYTSIDDRGFLVRLNGNPSSDRHWLPGDPEPGDPGWVWNTYYGVFGAAGFNDSAFDNGLPLSVNGQPNEVYELALYGGTPSAPGGPLGSFTPCSTTLAIKVSDPKGGNPSQVQLTMINGSAHIVAQIVPEPASYALLGLAGLALLWRKRS